MTKSRWASQERIDLMMLDLDKQTQWLQAKEQEEQAWAEQQQQREKHRRQEEEESGQTSYGNSGTGQSGVKGIDHVRTRHRDTA